MGDSGRRPHPQSPMAVDGAVVDRLGAMHGPGESYSDVILRLVKGEARA